jgi:hypothetical protein
MVGLWDLIRLVRAMVREKRNLGIFQFHHNPHPKTNLHPGQTSCLSLVRNQVGSLVRNRVKSLTPSLSPDQSISIVSFVERMVTRESFAIREGERREWLRSRVSLTVGNRPYRSRPVTVPAGYQPVGLKIFGFEFKKLKNEKKSLKILHDFLSLMVSIFLQTSSIYYKFQPKQVKPKAKKTGGPTWPT